MDTHPAEITPSIHPFSTALSLSGSEITPPRKWLCLKKPPQKTQITIISVETCKMPLLILEPQQIHQVMDQLYVALNQGMLAV